MKEKIKAINRYLSEKPPEVTKCQMEKMLDVLYCCYAQRKGDDSAQVRHSFGEIDRILGQLPLRDQDAVVDIACALCAEHEREGFCDGIIVGFRLFSELAQ